MVVAGRIRVGLVGMGYIGAYVYGQISEHPELGLEIAFVADQDSERLKLCSPDLVVDDLSEATSRDPDLIVEMAHPEITRRWGESFLAQCDYMPLSLTAFADAQLHERMLAIASEHGSCLYVPHGAVVGLDSIFECRDVWESVTVTMKKNPRNMDISSVPEFQGREITAPAVLYDGPTRGVCPLFPRNVNSHAAVALAGIGFDRTRSVLVADPSLDVSVIEIEARGQGVAMHVQRSNPLKGVSGTFTLRSIWSCICRAKAVGMSMQVC